MARGRRPGDLGKKTLLEYEDLAKLLHRIKTRGESPLDILLKAMLHFYDRFSLAETPEEQDIAMLKAAAMAKEAAPYVHPKLQSLQVEVNSDNVQHVISEKPMNVEEWAAQYGTIEEACGVGSTARATTDVN